MAISAKEIKQKIKNKINLPITPDEYKIIKFYEEYIDEEIKKQYTEPDDQVSIDLGYFNLNYDIIPANSTVYSLFKEMTQSRKEVLSKELVRIYKKAGWKIRYNIDDQPASLQGDDYVILY